MYLQERRWVSLPFAGAARQRVLQAADRLESVVESALLDAVAGRDGAVAELAQHAFDHR
jgi:hypothetical protein